MRQVVDVVWAVGLALVLSFGMQAIAILPVDITPKVVAIAGWAILWAVLGPGIIIWRSRR